MDLPANWLRPLVSVGIFVVVIFAITALIAAIVTHHDGRPLVSLGLDLTILLVLWYYKSKLDNWEYSARYELLRALKGLKLQPGKSVKLHPPSGTVTVTRSDKGEKSYTLAERDRIWHIRPGFTSVAHRTESSGVKSALTPEDVAQAFNRLTVYVVNAR